MSDRHTMLRKIHAAELLEWSRTLDAHGMTFEHWRSSRSHFRSRRRTQELKQARDLRVTS